jgi:hypothetical protein
MGARGVPRACVRCLLGDRSRHVRGDHVRARGRSTCRASPRSCCCRFWLLAPASPGRGRVSQSPQIQGRSRQEPAGPRRHGTRRDAWTPVTSLRRTCMHHQRRRAAVSAACRTCQGSAGHRNACMRLCLCMHAPARQRDQQHHCVRHAWASSCVVSSHEPSACHSHPSSC